MKKLSIYTLTLVEKLTQEEIEEANAFIESQEFKNMVKQAKESRQRVMNSKITNRTKCNYRSF